MKKKKIFIYGLIFKVILLASVAFIGGCTHHKPALAPTQIVQGKSIVIPPEFDIIPESAASTEE